MCIWSWMTIKICRRLSKQPLSHTGSFQSALLVGGDGWPQRHAIRPLAKPSVENVTKGLRYQDEIQICAAWKKSSKRFRLILLSSNYEGTHVQYMYICTNQKYLKLKTKKAPASVPSPRFNQPLQILQHWPWRRWCSVLCVSGSLSWHLAVWRACTKSAELWWRCGTNWCAQTWRVVEF